MENTCYIFWTATLSNKVNWQAPKSYWYILYDSPNFYQDEDIGYVTERQPHTFYMLRNSFSKIYISFTSMMWGIEKYNDFNNST